MNPWGVVFGENARLDVEGSFHATTADYLAFGEGGVDRFYASPGAASVLSVAAPTALGFLEDGAGSGLQPSLEVVGSTLAVPEGETLSLVGGPLEIAGGLLEARGGRINLASVASAGAVEVNALDASESLDVSSFATLGSLDVSGAQVDVSGDRPGTILIRGGELVLDGSQVVARSPRRRPGKAAGAVASRSTPMRC